MSDKKNPPARAKGEGGNKINRKKISKAKILSSQNMDQSWRLVGQLAQQLTDKLQMALANYDLEKDGWERLFGAKDSSIVNLQKLVGVLAIISDRIAAIDAKNAEQKDADQPIETLDIDDMQMLKDWLEVQLKQVEKAL
jgi:hypothetical protein